MTAPQPAMDTADEGVADRLVAYLVDFALLTVVAFAIWLLFVVVALVIGAVLGSTAGPDSGAGVLATGAVGLLFGLATWVAIAAAVGGYFTYMDADGQTFGKRLREVVVVTADGEPAGTRETAIRTAVLLAPLPVMALLQVFLSFVGFFLALGLMAGWLAVEAAALGLTEDHRRLGDRAAGTVVVKTAKSVGRLTDGTPADADGEARPGGDGPGGTPAAADTPTRE